MGIQKRIMLSQIASSLCLNQWLLTLLFLVTIPKVTSVDFLASSSAVKYQGQQWRFKREYVIDYSCNNYDCSQKKRPGYANDKDFHCVVGQKKECDKLNEIIVDDWSEEKNDNYAQLSNLNLYNKVNHQLHKDPYKSFNYSIRLPHKDKNGLKAKMIRTIFSSPRGPNSDLFYSKHPICRLFNFSSSTLTEIDLKQPRELSYPCIFGLDELLMQTDYTINITVYPYHSSLLYYIRTLTQDTGEFKLTTGIAVLPLLNKLHVVFEQYSHPTLKYYHVQLYQNKQAIGTIKVSKLENEHEFDLTQDGEYSVGIKPILSQGEVSEIITKSVTWRSEVKLSHKERSSTSTVITIVPSVLAALAVSLCALFLITRCIIPKCKGRGSNDNGTLLQDMSPQDGQFTYDLGGGEFK